MSRGTWANRQWAELSSSDPGHAAAARAVRARLACAIDAHRRGQLDRAIELYRDVVLRDARNFDALRLFGAALLAAGRCKAALSALERALKVRPDWPEVWAVRGDALARLGQHQLAADSYGRAIELRPDDARSRYNRGLLLLALGRYELGWEDYEWRQRIPELDIAPVDAGVPWDGSQALNGRVLLLAAEQGLGDTIQFCRYAAVLAERGAHVLLWVQPALSGLLTSLRGVARVLRVGEPLSPFEFQCRLLSAPARLRTSLASLPASTPYLSASPYKLEQWRAYLGPTRKPRIGLACSGGAGHPVNSVRSIPLRQFELLRGLDCELHLLQKDLSAADLPWVDSLSIFDHRHRLHDFEDTAALVTCMDVVVSVCTSIAHLAGALARPLYVLLSAQADWRWMLKREDSPWYPTARLLRQSVAGDWNEPLRQLRKSLSERFDRTCDAQASAGGTAAAPDDADPKAEVSAAGLMSRAVELHRQGYLARAVDGYLEVAARPLVSHPESSSLEFDRLRLLGAALTTLGDSEAAVSALEQALALAADRDEVWANHGEALAQLGRHELAAKSFERALSLRPGYVQVLNRYSFQLALLGRQEESLRYLQQAAEIAPDDPPTRYNLGVRHLLQGRLEQGWEGFEWRNRIGRWSQPLPSSAPLWDGSPDLAGRRLFLTAEQGLGDTIQFSRYANVLARAGAHVLLGVPPALRTLMGSLSGVAQVLSDGDTIPEHDLQCPLLSVPHRLRTSLTTIPADIPYLSAAPERIQAWRDRLGPGSRPRIGIACSGNPEHDNDRQRSIGLHHFAALRTLECELHWLQPDIRQSDRRWLGELGIADHRDQLNDVAETAALASCLDAVVSADTSAAHLAGALGLPLFVLLPHFGDWRWMLDRDDSPWYPSARLIRQARVGDWGWPMGRLVALLRANGGGLARRGRGVD